MLIETAVLFLLIISAMFDHTRRTVPDILSALLWMCVIFSSGMAAAAAAVFAVLFLGNTAFIIKNKEPVIAWGDILTYPPVLGVMFIDAGVLPSILWLAAAIGVAVAYYVISKKNPKDSPMVVYLAFAYVFALLPKFL